MADWPISETAEPDWLMGLALSWLAGFLLLLKLKVSFTQNETDMQGVCVCVCVCFCLRLCETRTMHQSNESVVVFLLCSTAADLSRYTANIYLTLTLDIRCTSRSDTHSVDLSKEQTYKVHIQASGEPRYEPINQK